MRIRDIRGVARTRPVGVDAGDGLWHVLQRMKSQHSGLALVHDRERTIGFYSEKIFDEEVATESDLSPESCIRGLMKTEMYFATPEDDVESAAAVMREHNIRNLPIVEGGGIASVLSREAVLQAIIAEKDALIQELYAYINGNCAMSSASVALLIGAHRASVHDLDR